MEGPSQYNYKVTGISSCCYLPYLLPMWYYYLTLTLRGIKSLCSFLGEDYADKLGEKGHSRLKRLMELSQRMEHLIESILFPSAISPDGNSTTQLQEQMQDYTVDNDHFQRLGSRSKEETSASTSVANRDIGLPQSGWGALRLVFLIWFAYCASSGNNGNF